MARKSGSCPACGGTVEFRSPMSLVAVCPNCQSVVARQDRQLSDQGRVAEIAESLSPLQMGLRGVFQGKAFRLIGRVQYQHSAGGTWDEWYIELAGGKWGWLSEAQARFGVLVAQRLKDATQIPAYGSLEAGQSIVLGSFGSFQVAEVGEAVVSAAEGELPFNPKLQAEHRFVDLEGTAGRIATIEYSHDEQPQIFLGESATLADLGLADQALKSESTRQVGAAQLNCPQCAGPLELAQPDAAERVTCPYCGALLDVNGGKLEYLKTLKPPQPPLKIQLGTSGMLRGVNYRVLGYLRRSVTYDKQYFWQEYILYSPREGYAWLIDSDDHWSLGKPVPIGSIERSWPQATYNGRTFKIFQKTTATVRQVWGEFHWKVAVGEAAHLNDYISPPYSLSLEISSSAEPGRNSSSSEINATLSDYLPHEEVEAALGVSNLPRGWGVAPNQPNPVTAAVYVQWVLFLLAIGLVSVTLPAITGRSVDGALTVWAGLLMSLVPLASAVYSWSFEYQRWQDSEYNPYASSGGDDD